MSNFTRKIASIGVSMVTLISLSGAASILPVASAQSAADLQAQIAALLAQISALQAQLGGSQGSGASSSYNYTRDLTVGSKGADVSALQSVLISKGYLKISAPTAYFGSLTKAALAAWQAASGISPAAGYFGPKSRAAFAGMGGGVVGGGPIVVVPSGTGLQVAVASDSPAARTIGSGTAFNPALKVVVAAGSQSVNITGITVMKTGFLANSNLNGVDVVDASGVRHGNVITSVNADNTIGLTFPSAPIVVQAGQSTSFLIRFNLLTGNLNGTVGFSIQSASAITSNASSVGGSFPLMGGVMNVVNGGTSLASTTLDVLTSTGSSTLNVDAVSQQEITKFRIQESSSNEGVNLYSLMLYNNGSGADTDVADVQLVDQAGNVLATAQQIGKYVTFNLATPFFMDKGQTKDFTIRAKVVNGAARTINFVIYNNYDVDIRGAATLVSVIPGAGSNDTSFPIGNGFNIQTVGSGTLTQVKSADSPSAAVTPSAQNAVLAKYTLKPIGEDYELRAVKFYVATATAAAAVTLNGTVYVKVNDSIVYSTAASNISATTATEYTLSSYPVISAGKESYVTIVGSVNSAATAASTYQVKSFQITQAKRLTTNDLVSNPTSATDANSIAVKAGALAVTTLATPVAQSIVAGTTQYEYATIKFDASTGGEDVNVSKVVVTSDGSNLTEVQNLYLYKDNDSSPLSTTASTASNAATVTFNLSSPFLVSRSAAVTLHLKADAVSGTNSHTFSVASSTSAITAVGVTTGNTLTNGSDITFAGAGQAQTHVSAGALVLSDASGSPNTTTTAAVGSTNLTLFAFKLSSQYETQKITSLTVYATSALNGLSTTTIRNVKFYENSSVTPFASAEPICRNVGVTASSTSCTYTVTASDNLLAYPVPFTGTTIYVKGDIGGGGVARLGDTFKFVMTSTTTDIAIKGSGTGSTSGTKTGVPAALGNTVVVSAPVVITAVSPTSAGTCGSTSAGSCGANNTLAIFKITNNGSANIRLSTSTTFRFNESGASTSTYDLYESAQDGSQSDASQIMSAGAVSVSGGNVTFDISTSSAANRQITGNGGFRYFTIKNHETAAGGTHWGFSVNQLGNLRYQVDNSQLGYDSDPYESTVTPTDLSGVAQGLFIDGKPALATITTGY